MTQYNLLLKNGHLIDPAVACRAANALVHMDAVVEVDEVRDVVHLVPLNRCVVRIAVAHKRQLLARRENL